MVLAALRLWGEPRQKTDGDLRAVIDSANSAMLGDIAEELAENRDPDYMPACSSKGLLTHLHASCTRPSSSHGRAFHRG